MYLFKVKFLKKFPSIFPEKCVFFGFECANIFISMVQIYRKVWKWHTGLNNSE